MNIPSIGSPANAPLPQPASSNTSNASTANPAQQDSGTIRAKNSTQSAAPASPVSRSGLDSAVKDVQKFLQTANTNLDFSVDKDTDKLVVKVVDPSTQQVIKQIPSEDMLALAKALDKFKGLLVSQKA